MTSRLMVAGSFQPALTLPSDAQLVAELHFLGIRHLSGDPTVPVVHLAHGPLLFCLATSTDARLRAALVPLFLWRPEFAAAASTVAQLLAREAWITLVCNYTAAAALQEIHADRLACLGGCPQPLADLFGGALELPISSDPSARLSAVASCHAVLSGEAINWLGTYHHAANAFLNAAERELVWTS